MSDVVPQLCRSDTVQFVVPQMALQVVDRAIQSFGAEGVSQDTWLAHAWAGLRTLRLADVSFVFGFKYSSCDCD